jgi:hypothetical protein
MSEDGAPLRRRERPPLDLDLYGGMLVRNHIEMFATVLFRRNILEHTGAFDPSLRSAEDYELLLRIARSHPTSFHHQLVAEYRRYEREGSSLSSDPAVMLRSTMRVLDAQRRFAHGNAFYETQLAEGIRFFQSYYGGELVGQVRSLLHEHRWPSAFRGTLLLLRHYPGGIAERLLRRVRTASRPARG